MSWSNGLVPELRPYAEYLVYLAAVVGPVRVTSVFRSLTEQRQLYENRHRNAYPVAPPGASYHNYGRAFDVTGDVGLLRRMGATWQSWGGTWGGERDPIHFQA